MNTKDLVWQALKLHVRHCAGKKNSNLMLQFANEALAHDGKFDEFRSMLCDELSIQTLDWAILWRMCAFLTQSRDAASLLAPPRISEVSWKRMLRESKELPEAVLDKNLPVDLIENYILNGYVLPGICTVGKDDTVLDLGAFNGNSAIVLGRQCPEGKVYAFEPNPVVRETLKKNLATMGIQNVEIVPNGVGNKTAKLKFKLDGAASRVSLDGDVEVDVVRIDDFVRSNNLERVDFLKFDIEGSEQAALQGARDTIRKFRPKIAMSVYHIYNDMTTLPFLIRDIGLWYKFYLRHNAITGGEIVLYGVPTGL